MFFSHLICDFLNRADSILELFANILLHLIIEINWKFTTGGCHSVRVELTSSTRSRKPRTPALPPSRVDKRLFICWICSSFSILTDWCSLISSDIVFNWFCKFSSSSIFDWLFREVKRTLWFFDFSSFVTVGSAGFFDSKSVNDFSIFLFLSSKYSNLLSMLPILAFNSLTTVSRWSLSLRLSSWEIDFAFSGVTPKFNNG